MSHPIHQITPEEERRTRNVRIISLGTGFIFIIVAAISGYFGYRDNGLKGLFGFGITSITAIASFISAYHWRRGRPSLGISILIGTIFILGLIIPFVVHGQGLALGLMVAIVVAGVSSATLPRPWATRAITAGFLIGSAMTVIDLYLPDFGLPTNPTVTNSIAAVTSVIYVFFILRNFNTYVLRTKIIIAFILVTIIPLVALSFFNARSSSQSLQEQNRLQLRTLAGVVGDTIDEFFKSRLDTIRSDSNQLALITFLGMQPELRQNSVQENNAHFVLVSLTRKDPVFIHSIAILDKNGINILDTFEEYKGRDEKIEAYFKQPFQTKLPYVSNVSFKGGDSFIYFSSPIIGQNGTVVGVLRVEYSAKAIQSIVQNINTGSSETIILVADTKTYLRVGYTGDRDELLKSFKEFNELELSVMQLENRLPAGSSETIVDGANEPLVRGIDQLPRELFFESYSDSLSSNTINTGVFLETQPWAAIIRQSTRVYLSPVAEQNRTNILISMALIAFSVIAGFLASQILTSPLASLTGVAEKIAAGDLKARAKITTDDEIGALANTFNRMTDELNQTVNSLELRVSERTADLEKARVQSEVRANELQAISEISKIIASEQKLETLFLLITRLVSEQFGYYHAGIFLLDETRQFAVLQAANSMGGRNMLARGHRLEVGGSGIVGYVAKTGVPRIALDVGLDAVFFNNPDLPNTRSEMALPLKVREQIVGVLDVQSEEAGAFTENDANTLGILADQIAIALENARLFAQTQQALNEAQALYQQKTQEGWLAFSREEDLIGYQQGLVGGKKLTTPVTTDEITQAMNRGSIMMFNADGAAHEPSIVVPIKLRGQVIGAMNIKAPTRDRQWTGDEIDLVEAISDRLSLALENARLIQESQRQLIKEQTISDVTGKISTSINLQNVLQTAVEELGRAMPGSEVVIKFERNEN